MNKILLIKILSSMVAMIAFVGILLAIVTALMNKQTTTRHEDNATPDTEPTKVLLSPTVSPKPKPHKSETSTKPKPSWFSQDPAFKVLVEVINESGSWLAGDISGAKHSQHNRMKVYEKAAQSSPEALLAQTND